jgi:dihydroorotase
MSEKIVIKGGRVLDPASGLDAKLDVVVEGGVIGGIKKGVEAGSARVIDASGLVVAPGLIDLHVHLREPGYEYKENVESGARAAAAGGFSAVCCMANTNPVNDNGSVTRYIMEKAVIAAAARVYPIGAVTKQLAGEELAEIGEMKQAGIVAISDDGRVVKKTSLLRSAIEYGSMFGLTLVEHCEDDSMAAGGVINEGEISAQYGIKGIPSVSEDVIVERDISVANYSGLPVHLAHISTRGAVEAIRKAKAKGIKVTCEVTPHHFTLTERELETFNPNCKMNPPLRSEDDVAALKDGLKDGTIDAIATDHAPHAIWEKEMELDMAPFGVVGLETALGLTLKLVHDGLLSLPDAIALLTCRPASVFNLPGGSLEVQTVADICVFDPEKSWKVDPESFISKGKNSCFAGMALKGKNILTMVGGRIVYNPANL